MNYLRLLPIFCLFLFIILQRIDVKVTNHQGLTVKINFNILAISLHTDRTRKTEIKKILKRLKRIGVYIKTFRFLLSKSDVTIRKFDRSLLTEFDMTPLSLIGVYTSIGVITSFISAHSKSFRLYNDLSLPAPQDRPFIDISISFSILDLIISALFFLYYIIENKFRRTINNV